jgi:hypothetical protein
MFGVDSLKRKYGLKPPDEWEASLSHLTDAQIRNGVDKLLKSGTEHMPSLPQFVAMCHQAREFEDRSDLPRLAGPKLDKWATAANLHLLDFVRTRAASRQHFDASATRILLEHRSAWAEDMRADDKGDGVPAEKQRKAWDECMGYAMDRITPAGEAIPV